MSERKNIERLFQEKFKDFEANPSEGTWPAIEAKLNEKKKRRIIPFWWQFSGLAAVFLIGIWLTKSVFKENATPNIPTQKTVVTTPKGDIKPTVQKKSIEKLSVVAIEKNNELIPNNTVVTHSNKKQFNGTAIESLSKNTVVETKNRTPPFRKNTLLEKIKKYPAPKLFKEARLAKNENTEANKSSLSNPKTMSLDDLKNTTVTNTKIVATEKKEADSIAQNSIAANALEELLHEKESKVKLQSAENKWLITSSIAPVFLGSVSTGSPIDPMFENNTKVFNTNLSVGLGISYALNTKFSVRTGLNKMEVDYNTTGVVFYADIQSSGMENVNLSATGKSIKVENTTTDNTSFLPFENAFIHKNEGYINQKMGYIEMPVEMTYAILSHRFGIKVIGGISSFFLTDNNIKVVSDNISTDLGKANNLNDVHFSTNLGVGLQYNLWKAVAFHVEPTFKYQLNTYSANAGNFKPYFFGVYSGISYKF